MSWLEKMMERMEVMEREGTPREHLAEAALDAMASDHLIVDDSDDLVY